MTIISNEARFAPHDAVAKVNGTTRGYNRYWTRRAVALLRRLQVNPFVKQARNHAGQLDANGHGAACVNQVLVEMLDNIRAGGGSFNPITRILPLTSDELIKLNDSDKLSFAQIANRIELAAGGAEALADA